MLQILKFWEILTTYGNSTCHFKEMRMILVERLELLILKMPILEKNIDRIEERIKMSYARAEEIAELQKVIDRCRMAMIILRKKSGDYASEDLSIFSFCTPSFTNIYGSIFGRKMLTTTLACYILTMVIIAW